MHEKIGIKSNRKERVALSWSYIHEKETSKELLLKIMSSRLFAETMGQAVLLLVHHAPATYKDR